MADPTRLNPVDRWMGFANLAFLASWLPLTPESSLARWLVLVHLAGLLVPWLLLRRTRPLSPFGSALHDGYPLLWTAVFWNEFGLRHDLTATALNDPIVAGWDLAVFGGHWNVLWVSAMPWPGLSELLQGAYFSYYLMLVAIPVALIAGREPGIRRDIVLRIAATYLGCFLIYSYFPVIGPRELWPTHQGALTEGLFYQINAALRSAGDSLGTAFPSSHTAGAVTFAWIAWLYAPRALAWLIASLAVLIAAATVYTQNHFAIDTLAGVVVAGFMQAIVVPFLTARRPLTLGLPPVPTPGQLPKTA